MQHPETPEAVALVLLTIILSLGGKPENQPPAAWVLDTYAACLNTAAGGRAPPTTH